MGDYTNAFKFSYLHTTGDSCYSKQFIFQFGGNISTACTYQMNTRSVSIVKLCIAVFWSICAVHKKQITQWSGVVYNLHSLINADIHAELTSNLYMITWLLDIFWWHLDNLDKILLKYVQGIYTYQGMDNSGIYK